MNIWTVVVSSEDSVMVDRFKERFISHGGHLSHAVAQSLSELDHVSKVEGVSRLGLQPDSCMPCSGRRLASDAAPNTMLPVEFSTLPCYEG